MKFLTFLLFSAAVAVTNVSLAASLKIYTAVPTQITIYFDSGREKTVIVKPKKPFSVGIPFITGFSRIQWTAPEDGHLYEALLNIKGLRGFYTLRIVKNSLTIEHGEHATDIFAKPIL